MSVKVLFQSVVHAMKNPGTVSDKPAIGKVRYKQKKFPLGSGQGATGIGGERRRKKIDSMVD